MEEIKEFKEQSLCKHRPKEKYDRGLWSEKQVCHRITRKDYVKNKSIPDSKKKNKAQ